MDHFAPILASLGTGIRVNKGIRQRLHHRVFALAFLLVRLEFLAAGLGIISELL